ncbi:hypothetical protein ACIOJE_35185 [Kitasatospora sp. NPDC087861]|uniref:hypothetical protein n=1 Tax=Kitasatospora sp. NPDC087861 TaxID=3364070 RepID=UPI0038284C7E
MVEKSEITVCITAVQAARFQLRDRQHRAEKVAYALELEGEGLSRREARLEVARVQADWWPPAEELVAASLRRRLAEEDVAGPWEPLTEEEELGMELSGRWPGPNIGRLRQRHYSLPSDLVKHLRTASWRLSEGAFAELDRLGIRRAIGTPARLRNERERLVALLCSPAQIVREALDWYPKGASGDRMGPHLMEIH